MKVDRTPAWVWHFQACWFVLTLTVPAYLGSIRTCERLGDPLAWYHRVGLAIVSLLGVLGMLAVVGLILFGVFRLVEGSAGRAKRRRRRARRREKRADRVPRV